MATDPAFDAQAWYQQLVDAAMARGEVPLSQLPVAATVAELELFKARREVCVLDGGRVPRPKNSSVPGAAEEHLEPRLVRWTCPACPCTSRLAKKEWYCLIGDPRRITHETLKNQFKTSRKRTLRRVIDHWNNKAHINAEPALDLDEELSQNVRKRRRA